MTLIQWLQHTFPAAVWDPFWFAMSKIYSEDVFLALLPIVFWVADRRFARYFAVLFVGQMWLNALFKGIANLPRPAESLGIRVKLIDTEGGYSFPSGHSQGSAAVFAGLAQRIRRRWFTALAVLIPFLVGVSRLYFGNHWPSDVLFGWLIGVALALGLAALWPALAAATGRIPFGPRLALALLLPAAMVALWQALPFVARVGLANQYPALGALAGIWCGTLLEERYVRFDPSGRLGWHLLKCVLGIALVLAVRYGLKAVLPEGDWWGFLRYCAIGATVSLGAPWVFTRLRRPQARVAGAA